MTDPSATAAFEAALLDAREQQFVLRLYVVGATPASRHAVANLTAICESHLRGRYTLQVIDLYQQPAAAAEAQIVAAPTLLRLLPKPIARIVGDLSDEHKVLVGLDLRPVDG